ncbi:SDR family NAD(P)-dependent oxidoreductase [Brevundimonas vesicularis]|uniref:SDR family NAD(P)-dependent oxidoreductase n=1 Tax=Brevundimonas vesicularis TaxID=41276 RepID=UPI0038D39708
MVSYGMNGKTVVVTGGASGIGRATALALARDGARVAIMDLSEEDIAIVVEELRGTGAEAFGVAADVASPEAVAAAADAIFTGFGEVDGLVACAGTSAASPAEDHLVEDWNRVMGVNLLGAFLCCQVFGRPMISRRAGAIVVIGSLDGIGAHAGRIAYSTSKFAVHGMVKNLALEWGRHNIRINCVAPTIVDTPLVRRGLPDYFFDVITDRTPAGRIGHVEDIASAVLSLMSDASSYLNGVILPVDGGLTAGFFNRLGGADLQSKKLMETGVYQP